MTLKNIINNKILFLFVYIISFTACKKYPEDGKLSWHKPEKRLEGSWTLKEFYIDEKDSLYHIYKYYEQGMYDTANWILNDAKLNFSFPEKGSTYYPRRCSFTLKNYSLLNMQGQPMLLGNEGNWSFYNKKRKLSFETTMKCYSSYIPVFGHQVSSSWEIRKLTEHDLIIEVISNDNKKIRLKFLK